MEYFLISNMTLLVFYGFYRIGLKRFTFFNLNRWYILLTVLGTYLLPLPLLFQETTSTVYLPLIDLNQPVVESKPMVMVLDSVEEFRHQYGIWLSRLYWAGVAIGLVLLCYRLIRVLRDRADENGDHSYTFFNRIRLGRQAAQEEAIRQHELLHMRSGHSYDLLFLELIQVFNWFNPIFYFLKRELKLQQEYWVDEHFSNQRVAYSEKLLAYAMRVPVSQFTHEFSNQSILKERIVMLFKEKSHASGKKYYLLSIPLALIVLVFSLNLSAYSLVDANSSGKYSQHPLQEETVHDYDQVEVKPGYPGGFEAFSREVARATEYPEAAVKAGVRGTVEISFVVDQEGKVADKEVVRDLGHGLGAAVMDAISKSKDWTAGEVQGKAVNVRYLLPVRFDLSAN